MQRPMRIAMMLESDGPGGAEVMVLQLSEELRRRGHTVIPVGPAKGVGWLGTKYREAGFSPEVFRIRRALDLDCARSLMEIFRKHEIDVVHSHEFTMAVYGTLATRRLGLPHLITLHGSQTMNKVLRRRIAVRWAMRNSAGTVAVSKATRVALVKELGVPEERFIVVPNGVPVRPGDPTRVRSEIGWTPGELVLLAVGNLDRRKGHMFLLRALQQIRSSGSTVPWRLVIAGGRGGEERGALEAYAQEQGFADRLNILTRREDIPDLQAMADIFVMPSLWEGLPMAMLEAMIAGNPVVASRISGIPEAITHGEEGLLTEPGDVDGLAAALRRLLEDDAYRLKLARAARQRGHAEFTVGIVGGKYEQLLQDAIASKRRGSTASAPSPAPSGRAADTSIR
jgi:glycosyltransferase involved in cell wall biosynthesis